MVSNQESSVETVMGSILPGMGGAVIGGAAGAVWGHNAAKRQLLRHATLGTAIENTPLALVKQHKAALEQEIGGDKGVREDWSRMVEGKMRRLPPSRRSDREEGQQGRETQAWWERESKVYEANRDYHLLAESGADGVQIAAAEGRLHTLAAQHIVETRKLKPLAEETVQQLGTLTRSMPNVPMRRAIIGGVALAAVGGMATQALLGHAERPRNSHAERVRAELQASAMADSKARV